MFAVDECTARAIRRAYEDGGELAGVVELRRHFPLIADNSHARLCVLAIAGWKPLPEPWHLPNWTRRETGGSEANQRDAFRAAVGVPQAHAAWRPDDVW